MMDWFQKPEEFGLGDKSLSMLRAIRNKLSADYRPLISDLKRRFRTGPASDVLQELDELVRRTTDLLHGAVQGGRTSRGDSNEILNSIGRIEHLLQVLNRFAKSDSAFEVQVKASEKKLGISLKNLTVTRRQAAAGLRSPGLQTRERLAVGAGRGYDKVLAAAASVVGGPFAPWLHMGLRGAGLAAAAGGRGLSRAIRGPREGVEGPGTYRGRPYEGGHEGRDFLESMRRFYNIDAYKSRWTREVLDVLKGGIAATGRTEGPKGVLGTIKDSLKQMGLFGAAVSGLKKIWDTLPVSVRKLVSSFGLLSLKAAGVAGAAAFAGVELRNMVKAFQARETEAAKVRTAFKRAEKVEQGLINRIRDRGPDVAAKELGYESTRAMAIDITSRRRTAQMQEFEGGKKWYERNWGIATPLIRALVGGREKPKMLPFEHELKTVEKELSVHPYQRMNVPERYRQQYPDDFKRITAELEKINKTLKDGQKTTSVPFSGVGPRNSFDSSDQLTGQFLQGGLGVAER